MLRKAELKDLESILQLNKKLFEFEYDNFDGTLNTSWPENNESYYNKSISDKDYYTIVYEIDDRIVGYVISNIYDRTDERLPARAVKIQNMFILKEYQSKGIGKSLINSVEKWAKDNKASEVSILTSVKNQKALDVYHALDYKDYDIILAKKIK